MTFWIRLRSLLRSVRGFLPAAPVGTIRRSPHSTRLSVEVLEDRLALSAWQPDVDYAWWREQVFNIDQVEIANDVRATIDGTLSDWPNAPTTQGAGFESLIGLDRAFANFNYRGQGYTVAVIDTGIDYNHSALGGGWGRRVVGGWDFVNNDADPIDDNGHGTHVAGIIGSSDATYRGVAPSVNLVALKVLGASGAGSFGHVEQALQWVINNRDKYNIVAVNLSLGSGNFTVNPYSFLEDEFSKLEQRGVLISSAAGNSYYTYGSRQGLGYPAVSENVVAVGAVWTGNFGGITWASGARDYSTAPDRIASFSQRGNGLDIFAPGALVTSTYRNNGYQAMAGTSMAAPVIAGAAVLIHQAMDARGIGPGAMSYQDFIVQRMQASGATVVDGDDENDNVVNTGMSFKRLDVYGALSSLGGGATNRAPTLGAIPNQTLRPGTPLVVSLPGSDADGDSLTYSARVVGGVGGDSRAYELDQRLGLKYAGGYFQNVQGRQEKWLYSDSGQWYLIFSNGELRRWAGTISATLTAANLVATLDAAYYADPSRLWNAQQGGSAPVALSISGNRLTIQATSNVSGGFQVEVTVSDGRSSATGTFSVNAGNAAPTLGAIATQTVRAGSALAVTLPGSDVNGDALTYSARIMDAGDPRAYELDQRLKLRFTGNYFTNLWGRQEKWIHSESGHWYLLFPNGELRRWAGSIGATLAPAALMGTVDAKIYTDPSLLWNAQKPAGSGAMLSVSGGRLAIQTTAGALGSFQVEVTVSDGQATAKGTFAVNVVG